MQASSSAKTPRTPKGQKSPRAVQSQSPAHIQSTQEPIEQQLQLVQQPMQQLLQLMQSMQSMQSMQPQTQLIQSPMQQPVQQPVQNANTSQVDTSIANKKFSLGTSIKMKLFDNFVHIVENPKQEDLKQFYQDDRFTFKFNNKSFGAYIDIPNTKEYFKDYYRTFGTPFIFGLYSLDKTQGTDSMIGAVSLVLRHDNKVWQIMDLKIAKEFRGKKCLDNLITSTLTTRIKKSTAYYAISMNPNARIDAICNNMKLPKMKNRGKMHIYLVSYDNIKNILPTLETFYCSEIGFINNGNDRLFIDNTNNRNIKLLHLHHNADYREFDFHDPQKGYAYCFAIHEDNDFIVRVLKEEYAVEPSASANIFSNDFKADWSKFVKTFEI